ncbi:MAG: phage tail tape measure protein, partial [Synergistaceae bacterium]|nr:phage tail tape measure protein [Synergistaceae bacterium]
MSKQLAVSFMIGASLGSGFQNTMSAAAKQFQTLGASAKDMAALASRAGSYQGLLGKVKGDRGKLAQLRAQAKAMKGLQGAAPQTKRLNDQILRLEANLSKDIQTLRKWSGELKGAGVDTRRLGEEQGRLQQQSKRASSALARLSAAQSRLGETRQKLSWSGMKGSVIASGAMLMALKAPVAVAASFEQAMARVEAVSFGGRAKGEQAAALAAMREQALALGSTTRFTAMEAAQSQENLARAGFKSNEIIAAMPGLLDMAAAEGMDLAAAADIASSTLRGLGLDAGEMGRIADVLAKTSAASNTNIAELGEGMKEVAPLAATLGVSLEETAALMGTMANAGIKGTKGGTALKAAFLRLSKEPKAAEAALLKLGVASRDAQGRLRTLPSLMAALSEEMRGMGEAEQLKHLGNIFGSVPAPAMAAVMGDTTQGAWTRLSSAWEGLMVTVGDVIAPCVRLMSD